MSSRTNSSSIRTVSWLLLTLGAVALSQACANRADDCDANSTCSSPGGTTAAGSPPTAGNAGSGSGGSASGDGGSSTAGSATGGTATQAGEAGTGGGTSAGGEGGTAPEPCNGGCADPTPVCKVATDTCVECLAPADCTTGDEAQCDTTSNTCVECLDATTDCPSATASRCEAGSCAPCEDNNDCAHIAGKTVCDTAAGECVQCTGTDYESCGMDAGTPLVCNSLTRTCTTNKQASAGLCQPCVADAQCTAGKLCVAETFGDNDDDVGYFCFWKKGDPNGGAPSLCSSARPYVSTLVNQTSIDGAIGDICGLAVSTCVARNEFRSEDCSTSNAPDDSKCGFAPGEDSKCAEFDTGVYRCTVTCGSNDDCPNGFDCDLGANPPVCEL